MTNSTKTSMSGFFEMGKHIKNNLNFSGLQDTPTGYDEGKFLRSTDNGVEYVDISGKVPVSFLGDIVDKPTTEVLGGYLKLDNVGKLVWSPATTDGDIAYTITGATHITGLLDTPDGYDEGKFLRSTDNGVEYVDISGQVPVTFEEIIGTPDQYQSGKYLVSTETGIEYRDIDLAASSFIELSDTPRDYDDGKYLASTANGLEWVDATTTEGGDDTSVVPEVYDNINSLPLAINQDGAIVRVGCDLYVSCDGQWKPLVESGSEQLPVSTIPGCIKNINELTLYQAYKDKFIADNSLDSFEAGFDQTFQSLIYDVCLYTEDPANIVKIDQTTYKWGIFKDTTEVNISATPQQVSDGSVSFVRWDGVGAVFGDPLDANTTLTVDKDLAITAYFARLYSAGRCADVLLFIDAAQNIKDLSSKNSEIISEGPIDRDSDGLHFGRGGNFTRYSTGEYTRATIPSSLFGNSKTFTFQFRLTQAGSDGYLMSIGNADHYVTLRIWSGELTMHIGNPGIWGTNMGTGIVPVIGKWHDITMRYGSRYDQIAISIDGVEFDWSTKADSNGSSGGFNTLSTINATSYLTINSTFSGSSFVNADHKNIKIFEGQATNISTIDPTSTLVPVGCTSLLFSSLNGSGNDDENLTFAPVVPHGRIMAEMDSGKSAVFNGSNSYIDTQLNLHDLTNLSLSFWAYWDSSVNGAVVGSTNNSGALNACRQQIQLIASTSRFDYTSRQGDLVRHTISLPEGWHHFAVTDNNSTTPSDAVNMYVDGIPVSYSVLVNNGGYSTNTNMQIGRTRQGDNAIGRYLNTELDDLRIYSDILTPTEIQYISRNDRPHIPTDNLTAYYKFDGNVNDQSELYDGTSHSITYTESANFSFGEQLLLTDKPFTSLGTEAYTIEFLVKTDEFQTTGVGGVIFSSHWEGEQGGCAGSAQYWSISIDGTGLVKFNFRDTGNYHTSSISITLGVWNHVAITYDGSIAVGESGKSTGYTFWINGQKAGEWGSYIQRNVSGPPCVGQINGVVDMGGYKLDTTLHEVIGDNSSLSYIGFLGSLKGVRIIKGKSIYSADFTPPTVIQNLCE
tara:strand:- start:15722 stop:18937 length:3216 start_codon:yes stop_codon:yes gene_type:complete